MLSVHCTFALRASLAVTALILPSFNPGAVKFWQQGSALADPAPVPEKDAFEAAKELGTVDAWNAFLATYPTGFRADLARAYVKKLEDQKPSSSSTTTSSDLRDYPTAAGSWGGIVRDGPGQGYNKLDSLAEGEPVSLMGKADDLDNGYPWFKIWYGPEQKKGYMWGGIMCSTGAERPDLYKTCSASPAVAPPPPLPPAKVETKRTQPVGCGGGYVAIDGKCVLKRDASTYCGPGYRQQGNKCVIGYQPPKPQKQLPTWQQKAIQHGCPKGMDWNAQEGCHEND